MICQIVCIFSQPRTYAKDTSLTFASVDLKHTNDCLDNELNRVYTWLSASKLTVNLTKTEFMLVASRQKLSTFPEIPSFCINDHLVKQVSYLRNLVVCKSTKTWTGSVVCRTFASAMGASKRIGHLIPFNILIRVYDSLVQRHFKMIR